MFYYVLGPGKRVLNDRSSNPHEANSWWGWEAVNQETGEYKICQGAIGRTVKQSKGKEAWRREQWMEWWEKASLSIPLNEVRGQALQWSGEKGFPAARTGRAKCWRSGEKASAADAKRAGGVWPGQEREAGARAYSPGKSPWDGETANTNETKLERKNEGDEFDT